MSLEPENLRHPTAGRGPGSHASLDEYGLVNLTKLNWSQPLTASIRIHLGLHDIPTALPVTATDTVADATPLPDDDIKFLVENTSVEPTGDGSGASGTTHLVWNGKSLESTPRDGILPAQIRLAGLFADELGNRGRSGAILAILLTELGWPVKKISAALEVSRPTLNKWVMIHAGAAVTTEELDVLVDLLESEVGVENFGHTTPLHLALVDARSELLRTKRSGLSWQKAAFLPTPEITDIVRALWAVSVRVRGEKSSTDDQMCSHALDMFIDLLLRRGVTAQNLGRIVGVTHAAVLHRWNRSRIRVEGDEYGRDWWLPQDRIASATEGFVPPKTDLDLETKDLLGATVTHRRSAEELHEEILFAVHTHEASEINPVPLPNVYVLSAVNGLSSVNFRGTMSRDDDVRAQVIDRLYELDEAPTGDAMKEIRTLAADFADTLRFEPLRVSTKTIGTQFALSDLLEYLEAGGMRVDQLPMSPMADPVVLPALFDVDRYGYPQITNHREWTEGVVLSETLLVQAVGQYDRDAEAAEHGRPGFGATSHHWVPAETLGAMIDLVTYDQVRDRIAELQETDRVHSPTQLRGALERFLPDDARVALERWSKETDFGSEAPTPLTRCLTTPLEVLAEYNRPKRRSA